MAAGAIDSTLTLAAHAAASAEPEFVDDETPGGDRAARGAARLAGFYRPAVSLRRRERIQLAPAPSISSHSRWTEERVRQSPPPHIENWREGAEGERATAKALRPLTSAGWVLVNDLQTDRGNIDHVLVGPAGVFMLESKKLGGLVSVSDDKLRVRRRDAPDDGYVLDRVGSKVRGQAAALHERFRAAGVRSGWLQAIVVVWSTFEQGVVDDDRTVWVHGTRLVSLLTDRPTRLSAQQIAEAAVF